MYAHKSTLVRIGEAHQQFQGIWRYGSSYTKQLAASWLRCGSSSLYATRRTVRLSSVAECAAVSNSEDQVLTSKPKPTRKALKGSLRSRGNTYGIFLCSGSPAAAEAISFSGVDWVCIDTQHGAVGYAELANLIRAVALGGAKSIVRVGGPDDRYGIQQALE